MKYKPNAQIHIGGRTWYGPALVRATTTEQEVRLTGAQGRDSRGRFGAKGQRPRDVVLKQGEVMFALVKSVKIRGRPYLLFDSPEQAFALQVLRTAYLRAVGGGK